MSTMADAEIIRLDSRGAPRRADGPASSSAPRSAADDPRRGRAAGAQDAGVEAPQVPPRAAADASAGSGRWLDVETAARAARDAAGRVAARPAGIPVEDLLRALAAGAQQVLGEDWERRATQALAMVRRRVTGNYEVDDFGFDPEITSRIFLAALRPIAQKWFRVEVRGVENIPAEGGALIVANHSGTVPVDGLMTMLAVHDHASRHLRALGADLIFTVPVLSKLARQGGATLACAEDAERMLSRGELVGVWPEGFKGVGKPYSERYKLQRFGRGGFVAAAMRTGVPIVPCSIVGAEEIYPLIGNIPSLARLLRVPYIPITPFFPLLGPLGLIPLPSKWVIEFGEPIRTDAFPSGAAEDPMLVFNVTDQVRETVQQTLYELLVRRERVFF
jgi:1-acyl-sn-glycerol-3-phosphate acyltransferase